jgi:uncharacterized protein YegP (UPF0339 family)
MQRVGPRLARQLKRATGCGPSNQTPTQGRAQAAKFVLQKGSTGKFRFNLVATSEAYESKASAINGIESVKRNAPDAEIDDQTDK